MFFSLDRDKKKKKKEEEVLLTQSARENYPRVLHSPPVILHSARQASHRSRAPSSGTTPRNLPNLIGSPRSKRQHDDEEIRLLEQTASKNENRTNTDDDKTKPEGKTTKENKQKTDEVDSAKERETILRRNRRRSKEYEKKILKDIVVHHHATDATPTPVINVRRVLPKDDLRYYRRRQFKSPAPSDVNPFDWNKNSATNKQSPRSSLNSSHWCLLR